MDDNSEKQIPLNKLKQIVKICGRVQKLLKMVEGFINSEENAMLKELKNNLKCEIGNDIAHLHLDISSCFINCDLEKLLDIMRLYDKELTPFSNRIEQKDQKA